MKRKIIFIVLSITLFLLLIAGVSLLLNYFFDPIDKIKYESTYSPEFDKPSSLRYLFLYGFILLVIIGEYYLYKLLWKSK